MPDLVYDNVGISALAVSVPSQTRDNLDVQAPFSTEDASAVVEKTGIRFRRVANASTCASDLCWAAADHLLQANRIDRDSIDALIFVSQTPDYRMPATGIILQHRLGLGKETLAFDVNLGCSGFVYGLSIAYSYCLQDRIRRVLLLNGETRTRAYSMRDRATGLLFGDAGSAALIEKGDQFGKSHFSLYSDGSRYDHIIIRSGGYRNPSSPESLREREYECGSIRHDEHGEMQGANVFEFLLMEIPKSIKHSLEVAGITREDVDYFVFHQANRFMNEHLRKKLRLPEEKTPYSLEQFGNTSSVSIPLTMAAAIGTPLGAGRKRLFLSGFGVGLSWGNAVIETSQLQVAPLIEYTHHHEA